MLFISFLRKKIIFLTLVCQISFQNGWTGSLSDFGSEMSGGSSSSRSSSSNSDEDCGILCQIVSTIIEDLVEEYLYPDKDSLEILNGYKKDYPGMASPLNISNGPVLHSASQKNEWYNAVGSNIYTFMYSLGQANIRGFFVEGNYISAQNLSLKFNTEYLSDTKTEESFGTFAASLVHYQRLKRANVLFGIGLGAFALFSSEIKTDRNGKQFKDNANGGGFGLALETTTFAFEPWALSLDASYWFTPSSGWAEITPKLSYHIKQLELFIQFNNNISQEDNYIPTLGVGIALWN